MPQTLKCQVTLKSANLIAATRTGYKCDWFLNKRGGHSERISKKKLDAVLELENDD